MNHFSSQLKFIQKRVNRILIKQLNIFFKSEKSNLLKSIKYSILFSGKRLRPFLIYTIGKMLKTPIKNLDIPAIAIECVHTYSLIHDDLPSMDNDTMRRGKPTCHIYFGEAQAILSGNALLSFAFEIISNDKIYKINDKKKIKIIKELANTSGANGLCKGQYLDIKLKKKINISQLRYIYFYKTGILIRSAIRISLYISGIKKKNLFLLLDKYGNILGLIFQLYDDIMDEFKDKKIKNKKTKRKITYPYLIGLKKTKKEINKLCKKAIKILKTLKKKYKLDTKILKNLIYFIIKQKK